MFKKSGEGLSWLEFTLFQGYPLKQGVFLRQGGVSLDPYASLNVSDKVGDEEKAVLENRRKISQKMGVPLVFADQVHGKESALIKTASEKPSCDALITSEPNLGLVITHADCQAAIFYDPRHHKLALVHAGWRGSTLNIYKEVILQMERHFQTKPEELLVGIGPSLGPEESEFIHFKKELPPEFYPFQVKPNYFDFWAISEWQLTEAGIKPAHIEMACISTFQNPKEHFSYRRDRVTGREATVACLLPL